MRVVTVDGNTRTHPVRHDFFDVVDGLESWIVLVARRWQFLPMLKWDNKADRVKRADHDGRP